MVMFVMIIAIMSIMMGAAVEIVSFQMRREREAELIFRGQQYIEGIRLFRLRYGRYPMRLKEMWDANPRVLRKKWKDPITDSYDWGLVFLGQEGGPVGRQGRGQRSAQQTPTPRSGAGDDDSGEPGTSGQGGTSGRGRGEQVGPIVGVHSTSCDQSIKVYEGRTTYCEWRFVLSDQEQGRGAGGGVQPGRPGRPGSPGAGGGRGGRGGRTGPGSGRPGSGRTRPPFPEPTGTPYP